MTAQPAPEAAIAAVMAAAARDSCPAGQASRILLDTVTACCVALTGAGESVARPLPGWAHAWLSGMMAAARQNAADHLD